MQRRHYQDSGTSPHHVLSDLPLWRCDHQPPERQHDKVDCCENLLRVRSKLWLRKFETDEIDCAASSAFMNKLCVNLQWIVVKFQLRTRVLRLVAALRVLVSLGESLFQNCEPRQ